MSNLNSDSTSRNQFPEEQPFLEKAKRFLEELPDINPANCSACPSLPERVEKVREAFTVINQEISEIENMHDVREAEDTQPQLIEPARSFIEYFNSVLDCKC
jgi:hypothetical protein